jgi:hypothetical protein
MHPRESPVDQGLRATRDREFHNLSIRGSLIVAELDFDRALTARCDLKHAEPKVKSEAILPAF